MTVAVQADVEALLQLAFDNQPEPKVGVVIVAAQRAVERAVGMPFDADTALVATMTGRYTRLLTLPRWPVSGVTSLTVDGVTQVEGTDFVVHPEGYLEPVVKDTVWVSAPRGIVCTYNAGWADETVVPSVVRDLVAGVATRVWQAGIGFAEADAPAGITQETMGIYSVTYGEFAQDGSWAIRLNEQELSDCARLRRNRIASVNT